jgi:hypothetical protein
MTKKELMMWADHIRTEVPYYDGKATVQHAVLEMAVKLMGNKFNERLEKEFLNRLNNNDFVRPV